MATLEIHTDHLVTFVYRRWEELRDETPPPPGTWEYGIAGQRSWELTMHLYSAIEAKVEKIRWFAGNAALPETYPFNEPRRDEASPRGYAWSSS